jgi:hypothetical protein
MKEKASLFTSVQAVLDRIDDYALPPERYLNKNFGRGTWKYDPYTSCWIVVDEEHRGPGRGYLIIDHNMKHTEYVLPDTQIN